MLETFLIVYVVLSIFVALFSIKKRIGFGTALTIGLFLTPLAGFFAVLKSDNYLKVSRHITRFHCPKCNMEFTEPHGYCPHCKEDALEINLVEIKHLQMA
jgi:hypothetical protein